VLDWGKLDEAAGKRRLALVRELLAIRRREIVPRLAGATFGDAQTAANGLLTAHWRMGDGATLQLSANLSENEMARAPGRTTGPLIWGNDTGETMPSLSVLWHLGAR
jgi:maltooligosyltrehalose trehalohydrolase